LAAVVQTFILLIGGVMALGLWLDAAFGSHSPHGYGVIAAIQLPLFVLCFRSAKAPFGYSELAALGPRLALGALVAVIGWFAAGIAMSAAAAPARARDTAALAGRRREGARRDASARAEVLAACLQLSPVTPDSQPFFPATLAELPAATCPEATQPPPEGFVIEYTPAPADSTGHHRAFNLSVHDSPMTDTARTIEVTEAMVVRSWHGRGAKRYPSSAQQPLELLSRVGRCIEQLRDTAATDATADYPESVAEARRRRACEVRITGDSSAFREPTTRGYYLVRYEAPAARRAHDKPGGFTLLLEPGRDSLGRGLGGALLSFFSDSGGVVHVTRRPRAATAYDPAIPDCAALGVYGSNDPIRPCREYRPRQRWGLASELPTVALSFSGTGTLGIGEQLTLLPHFQPLAERDTPVEVRVRWDSAGRGPRRTPRPRRPQGKTHRSGG
jgi:hypothetical protein